MPEVLLLDTGPLGELTHPRPNIDIVTWLEGSLERGESDPSAPLILVPEIADYELRCKCLQRGFVESLARLDELERILGYLPIDTPTMRTAADLWAEARRRGRPTAPDASLDGDVILAAQTKCLERRGAGLDAVVVTDNVGHLGQFVTARRWAEISTGVRPWASIEGLVTPPGQEPSTNP